MFLLFLLFARSLLLLDSGKAHIQKPARGFELEPERGYAGISQKKRRRVSRRLGETEYVHPSSGIRVVSSRRRSCGFGQVQKTDTWWSGERDAYYWTSYLSCKDCSTGFYQDEEGVRTWDFGDETGRLYGCHGCPAGFFNTASKGASCSKCGAGQYQDAVGSNTCKDCPTGRFNGGNAHTICEACPVKSYGDVEGLEICKACAIGKSTVDPAQISCQDCSEGKISAQKGSECISCEAGKFSNEKGQGACALCQVGYARGKLKNG